MARQSLHRARFAELSARTFHDIVRLRVDTFVVEQACPYHELDGRDVRETTEHAWIEIAGEVACYLRVYPDELGVTWIGRVVTAPALRGRGLAAQLIGEVIATTPPPLRVSAQSRLASWYATLGFRRCGPDFVEDGIAHTPMRLGV